MPLERTVEDQIVTWAESLGGRADKFVSPGRRGAPDLILILPPGIVIFVEVKRPKRNRRSPQQKRWIAALQALGCHALFAESLDEVKKKFEEIMKRLGT